MNKQINKYIKIFKQINILNKFPFLTNKIIMYSPESITRCLDCPKFRLSEVFIKNCG